MSFLHSGPPLPPEVAARPVATSPHGGEVKLALRAGPTSPASVEVNLPERVRVLSVLVEDGSNTLSRISGLIRRKGFHVRSISVGPSRHPGRSRMTLTIDAGHAETDQVRKQLERLVEVIEIEDVTGQLVHSRELVVAKVRSSEVAGLVERGAKVLDSGPDGTTVEFAGEGKDVGDFIDELLHHGVLDVARSGPVVMRRTA
jgi:acetolactate synthase I/III small subunit